MKSIEEKLKDLPKVKLSWKTDFAIKIGIYKMSLRKKWQSLSFVAVNLRRVLVSVVIFLVLSLGIIPGYAYASNQVTIGHILFPIKKTIENVELKLSDNKSEKLFKFSLRRIEEAEVIAGQKAEEEKVRQLIDLAEGFKDEALKISRETNKNIIIEYKDKGLDALGQVARKVGVDSGDEVLDAIALTLDSFKNKNSIIKQEKDIVGATNDMRQGNVVQREMLKASTTEVEKKNVKEIQFRQGFVPQEREEQKEKVQEIKNLKREVKELELELDEEKYQEKDVDILIKKLNNRIDRAEKEPNEQKSQKIIKPTKALTGNAKFFMGKELRGNKKK